MKRSMHGEALMRCARVFKTLSFGAALIAVQPSYADELPPATTIEELQSELGRINRSMLEEILESEETLSGDEVDTSSTKSLREMIYGFGGQQARAVTEMYREIINDKERTIRQYRWFQDDILDVAEGMEGAATPMQRCFARAVRKVSGKGATFTAVRISRSLDGTSFNRTAPEERYEAYESYNEGDWQKFRQVLVTRKDNGEGFIHVEHGENEQVTMNLELEDKNNPRSAMTLRFNNAFNIMHKRWRGRDNRAVKDAGHAILEDLRLCFGS